MVRLLTIFFFTLLSFTSLGAAPYDVVFSQKIEGATGFSHIDPLVDAMGQHAGFVYCDRTNLSLVIDEFSRDTLVTIRLSGSPQKSIHYYSRKGDFLNIYVIIAQMAQTPKIVLVTLHDNDVSMKVVPTNCFSGFGSLERVVSQDIRLAKGPDSPAAGVWFEASLDYRDNVMALGTSTESYSTTILYSLDLEHELYRDNSSGVRPGNFYDDRATEFFGFTNYTYGYDFTASGGDSARGELKFTTTVVTDSLYMPFLETTSSKGLTRSVFSGNFDPSNEFDEIVYCGTSEDLDGVLPGITSHIACYSLEDQVITQLWYRKDSTTELAHIYRDRGVLVGTINGSIVTFLDYRNGTIVDSIGLDRRLDNIVFFETYANPSTLNLAGQAGDTIFVYRFQVTLYTPVTAVESGEDVPETFALLQNHPNPFNAETRLSFASEINQYLVLKIYNILGQEVRTLAAEVFPPGVFYAYWNGTDYNGVVQSSGVYFAKLQGPANQSQIIKLIFLK